MLFSMRDLQGIQVNAQDAEIGPATDLLFDDGGWIVRYIVVEGEPWLPEQRVLVPAGELGRPDWNENRITVEATRDQIAGSPAVAREEPVSRQKEEQLHAHFGWQPYWTDANPPPEGRISHVPEGEEMTGDRQDQSVPTDPAPGGQHLRSAREVDGYHVEANGGRSGVVAGFIIDDESWVIRYLVVDLGIEHDSRQVLLAAHLVDRVSFDQFAVYIDIDADRIAGGPEFDPSVPVNSEYEEVLRDYFGY